MTQSILNNGHDFNSFMIKGLSVSMNLVFMFCSNTLIQAFHSTDALLTIRVPFSVAVLTLQP